MIKAAFTVSIVFQLAIVVTGVLLGISLNPLAGINAPRDISINLQKSTPSEPEMLDKDGSGSRRPPRNDGTTQNIPQISKYSALEYVYAMPAEETFNPY